MVNVGILVCCGIGLVCSDGNIFVCEKTFILNWKYCVIFQTIIILKSRVCVCACAYVCFFLLLLLFMVTKQVQYSLVSEVEVAVTANYKENPTSNDWLRTVLPFPLFWTGKINATGDSWNKSDLLNCIRLLKKGRRQCNFLFQSFQSAKWWW